MSLPIPAALAGNASLTCLYRHCRRHACQVLGGEARPVKTRSDGRRLPLSTLSAGEWLGLSILDLEGLRNRGE